eukprot:TRINITY_DN31070_c0_g2_i1.p1 TRINITY_DN31070_c0_g2~~TRINITY_DN31070_c0_g2_i1.p1  ORF type:complete len:476 (+),score=123.87 TRINITY_DN31070_c0_g2_i1:44-1429(+)
MVRKWRNRMGVALFLVVVCWMCFSFVVGPAEMPAEPTRPPLLECLHDRSKCGGGAAGHAAANSNAASGQGAGDEGEGRHIEDDASLPPDPWVPPMHIPVGFKPAQCPDKYLTVNTHTWGRHHNQLQSVIHALVAAHLLNRTFVIGHFRHAKRWYDVQDFYSFAELEKHFCVIHHSRAAERLRGERDIHCMGQIIEDTPLGKGIRGKCRRQGFGKSFDNAKFKHHVASAVSQLTSAAVVQSRVVNLSGQLAFYMRPGLRLMSFAYGLLRPSPEVQAEVTRFVQDAYGKGTDYIAIHLRYREGTCHKELESDFLASFKIDDTLLQQLHEQCRVNYAYTKRTLQASLGSAASVPGADPNMLPFPAFLASDHQNKTAEQDLTSRGALPYQGKFGTQEIGGLSGLATDYFLLRGGHVFVGNTASSVSQNTCFGRLLTMPWRRACAGWNYALLTEMTETAAVSLATK